MKESSSSSWQSRRSQFNHQWLKNQFLSALDTVSNVFHGRLREIGLVDDFFARDLADWSVRCSEGKKLIEDFEQQMSPKALFEFPPLRDWEEPFRSAAENCMHEIWLIRYPVREWTNEAMSRFHLADNAYVELKSEWAGRLSSSGGGLVAQKLDLFRLRCRDLTRAIERFPSKVLVA